jgi:uncharacterized membrane protein YcjF (UPF0283 family)
VIAIVTHGTPDNPGLALILLGLVFIILGILIVVRGTTRIIQLRKLKHELHISNTLREVARRNLMEAVQQNRKKRDDNAQTIRVLTGGNLR